MKKITAGILFGLPLLVALPPFATGHWVYGLCSTALAGLYAGAMLLSLRWRAKVSMVPFAALSLFALVLPWWATGWLVLNRYAVEEMVVWDVAAAILATIAFAGLHLWRKANT